MFPFHGYVAVQEAELVARVERLLCDGISDAAAAEVLGAAELPAEQAAVLTTLVRVSHGALHVAHAHTTVFSTIACGRAPARARAVVAGPSRWLSHSVPHTQHCCASSD